MGKQDYISRQARRKRGGRGGMCPPLLADKLTLSQPGGHIIPTQYYVPPRFSDLATALLGDFLQNPYFEQFFSHEMSEPFL